MVHPRVESEADRHQLLLGVLRMGSWSQGWATDTVQFGHQEHGNG